MNKLKRKILPILLAGVMALSVTSPAFASSETTLPTASLTMAGIDTSDGLAAKILESISDGTLLEDIKATITSLFGSDEAEDVIH